MRWRASALAGLSALALYLWLAPPVSGDRDSSEFTLVLALDGIAHPTGYPLYTLLGHAFVGALHALGSSWAFAANAWSALGGAAAVTLMHRLAGRLLPAGAPSSAGARELLAAVPVALFVLNPAWAGMATVAEVVSWHQAWVMGAALLFSILVCAPARPTDASAAAPRGAAAGAAAWGLMCGVGLAHHLTSVLVSVPLSVGLLVAHRRGGSWRRHLAPAVGAALLPLASNLVLAARMLHPGPARWPALEPTWAGFWRHVTGAQYAGALGGFAPAEMEARILSADIYPFLFPGLVLLGAGLWRARRGPPRLVLGVLFAAALLQTLFGFVYGVGDPSAYFLPPLALALLGVIPFLSGSEATGQGARAARTAGAVALGALALVLAVPWTREARELRATLVGLDGMLRSMWASVRFDRGLVLWRNDMVPRLQEYQLLDHQGAGLDVLNPWTFTDPVVRRRFAARYGFDPVGDLTLDRRDLLAADPDGEGARRFFAAVYQRINAGTTLPVVVFAPEVPIVRVMDKPAGVSVTRDTPGGAAPP